MRSLGPTMMITIGLLLVGCGRARGPSVVGYAVAGAHSTDDPPAARPPIADRPTAVATSSAAPDPATADATAPREIAAQDVPPAPSPTPCTLKARLRDGGAKPNGRRFVLTLSNEGATPVGIVLPGDGSEVGWRTPVVTWSATTPKGKPVAPKEVMRCGMMNRIEASEIVTLAPGASRVIDGWIPSPPFAPGTYDVRLTYRNDPGIAARTDTDPAVAALVADTSACEATTNEVRARLR
jgi:hypothetical protein